MALDKEAIFAANRYEIEAVDVPEWGGTVHVRTMRGVERDAFEAEHFKNERENFRARIVAATCCDETGALIFTPDDVFELGLLSFCALDRVIEVAIRINQIGGKETDGLEKKSEQAPGDSSSSDSPDTTG